MTEQQQQTQTTTTVLYRIADAELTALLLTKHPGASMTEDGAGGMYRITDDAFIERATSAGAIEKVVGDTDIIVIYSPGALIPHITASEERWYDDGHVEYKIITSRGSFTLNGKSMMHGIAWVDTVFVGCKIAMHYTMREKGTKESLIALVQHVVNNAVSVDMGETTTQMKATLIMEQLYDWEIVDEREDFDRHNILLKDGMYHVRSKNLGDVVRGLGNEFPTGTRDTLKDYLADTTTQMRLADGKKVSVWRFKPWGEDDE